MPRASSVQFAERVSEETYEEIPETLQPSQGSDAPATATALSAHAISQGSDSIKPYQRWATREA